MAAAKTEDVAKKVRKLLRLAESPNEHEAARAREEAQRLMKLHDLSQDDVEDNVIEPIEGRSDVFRREILLVLAEVHGCSPVANNSAYAFRGIASKARAAAAAYRALVRVGEVCERDLRVHGSPEPVREAWRACFWLGLASRLSLAALDTKARRNAKRETSPMQDIAHAPTMSAAPSVDEEPEVQHRPRAVTEAAEAVWRTNGTVDAVWLAREAHSAGERAFKLADLDENLRAREGAGQTHKQLKGE